MDHTVRKQLEKIKDADMMDIASNPGAFGAPTFEEFKRNRTKYLGAEDHALASVDKGSHNLRGVLESRYEYEIEGFKCKTLEEVERIAADYGIPLRELDYRPQVIPQGGGRAKLLVKFVSKEDVAKRESWK